MGFHPLIFLTLLSLCVNACTYFLLLPARWLLHDFVPVCVDMVGWRGLKVQNESVFLWTGNVSLASMNGRKFKWLTLYRLLQGTSDQRSSCRLAKLFMKEGTVVHFYLTLPCGYRTYWQDDCFTGHCFTRPGSCTWQVTLYARLNPQSLNTQADSGGKVNSLEGHSVSHREPRSSIEYVSNFEC
jgi:hypothetical protein